jgi:hypothetical protein
LVFVHLNNTVLQVPQRDDDNAMDLPTAAPTRSDGNGRSTAEQNVSLVLVERIVPFEFKTITMLGRKRSSSKSCKPFGRATYWKGCRGTLKELELGTCVTCKF